VGRWDRDRGRNTEPPSYSRIEAVLLTSLLGGRGGAAMPVGDRIGALEPWEKVKDCESGPRLDLGLPCWDRGRIESLRIHELLDEIESLFSAIIGPAPSPCLRNECLLPGGLDEANCELNGLWYRERGGLEIERWLGRVWYCCPSPTTDGVAELVPGREAAEVPAP
jgi:hypothetical protein